MLQWLKTVGYLNCFDGFKLTYIEKPQRLREAIQKTPSQHFGTILYSYLVALLYYPFG